MGDSRQSQEARTMPTATITDELFGADFRREERTVELDGTTYVTRAYRIIGTQTTVIDAWETGARYTGPHAAVFRSEVHGLLGGVTSRSSAAVNAMAPLSRERMDAAHEYHVGRNLLALTIIRVAYPELSPLAEHQHAGGDVWVQRPEAA